MEFWWVLGSFGILSVLVVKRIYVCEEVNVTVHPKLWILLYINFEKKK